MEASIWMNLRRANPVTQIVIAQLVVTVLGAVSLSIVDWVYAYSALLGGISCVIPGLIALWRTRRAEMALAEATGNTAIVPVLQGEIWKFAVSVLLFIGVFSLVKPLSIGFFFGSFLVAQMCYALVPLIEARRLRNRMQHKREP